MGERKDSMSPDDGGWGRGNRVMGIVMTGLGLFIVLISANIIPMPDSTFSAPRWLAGCAGLAILLGGAAVVLARPGATPGSIAANPYLGGAAGLVLVVIFNWIAFGPGQRAFGGGFALPFIAVSGPASEWSGRVAFGVGAGLMDLFVVLLVVRGVKRWLRGGAGPAAP
jgi:hypothetical protein